MVNMQCMQQKMMRYAADVVIEEMAATTGFRLCDCGSRKWPHACPPSLAERWHAETQPPWNFLLDFFSYSHYSTPTCDDAKGQKIGTKIQERCQCSAQMSGFWLI